MAKHDSHFSGILWRGAVKLYPPVPLFNFNFDAAFQSMISGNRLTLVTNPLKYFLLLFGILSTIIPLSFLFSSSLAYAFIIFIIYAFFALHFPFIGATLSTLLWICVLFFAVPSSQPSPYWFSFFYSNELLLCFLMIPLANLISIYKPIRETIKFWCLDRDQKEICRFVLHLVDHHEENYAPPYKVSFLPIVRSAAINFLSKTKNVTTYLDSYPAKETAYAIAMDILITQYNRDTATFLRPLIIECATNALRPAFKLCEKEYKSLYGCFKMNLALDQITYARKTALEMKSPLFRNREYEYHEAYNLIKIYNANTVIDRIASTLCKSDIYIPWDRLSYDLRYPVDFLPPAHRAVYKAALAELPEDPALHSALQVRLTDGIQQIDDLTDYMGDKFPVATIALALYLDALTMEYTATGNTALRPLITRYDRAVRAAGVVGEEEYEHYMDTVCTWYDRHTERTT